MKIFRRRDRPAGRAEGTAPSLSPSDFVEDAVHGSARSQIKTSEVGDFCMALMSGLQQQGMLDEEQLKQRFHGVCPECGTRLTGQGLMMVTMAKQAQNPAFTASSAMTQRVFEGRCANERCKSKELVIEWNAGSGQ